MMKVVVLSLLVAACQALTANLDKPQEVKPDPKKVVKGINYSSKENDQLSNLKLTKQEIEEKNAKAYTGKMKDVGPLDQYIDLWYVNLKDSKDRKKCMDRQIEEMGMKSNRFPAFNFKRCRAAAEDDVVSCLVQKKYGDCVKSGLNWGAVNTHFSASNSELERQYHIVSNWCSHKRMMSQMLKQHKAQNSTKKYAVILEDDVAFDRKDFMRKVVNFCETYDGKMNTTWSMVQIDPFGSKCDKHVVGNFEGMPVWKPKNVNGGWECSNYWGAQALLVKYDAIPGIIKHMEDHPTVPLDWLPAHLPAGLAWRANIALNPEAARSVHMRVPMPQYCQKSVKQSTIGFRQKSLGRAMALAQKSGENVLDAAKVVLDPDHTEDYAELVSKYNAYNPSGKYDEWMNMQEAARTENAKYGIN
jgi:hypothetical protein